MLAWDDLKFFLAVAESGSMSAAAKALKVTQPTVGRRIRALERQLGAALFSRSSTGFALTGTGRSMLADAEAMREHATRAESHASGRDLGVEGKVRLSAAEWMLGSVLAPTLAPLLAQHPALELVLDAEPRHVNLARREADLALRPSEFKHRAVHQRAVATLEFGVYAADSYLVRHGTPEFEDGSPGHVLVDVREDLRTVVDREWLTHQVKYATVAVRCNGREPMATLAAAGIGLVCLPCFLGDNTPGLRRLLTPTPAPLRKLWLGIHQAARETPRIRVVADFLVQRLGRLRRALHPSLGSSRD